MDYTYAYLMGTTLILGPVWLFVFLARKDLRKEVLSTSFVIGVVGLFSELWYRRDYWNPEIFTSHSIGLEDFLFGFLK